jgi:regulatory protein
LRSKKSDSEENALQQGLRFLAYRPRSEAEVLSHLVGRGYSTAIAEATLERLRSLNYINDERFARNWARSRFHSRGYGPKKIAQELKIRGIGESLIRQVIRENLSPGDEAEKAKRLLEKQFKDKEFDDVKIARRAAAFLQRRGYSSEVIFDLLKHHTEAEDH